MKIGIGFIGRHESDVKKETQMCDAVMALFKCFDNVCCHHSGKNGCHRLVKITL